MTTPFVGLHVSSFTFPGFEGAGFFPVDLGDLATGGRMQAGGPLAGVNLVRLP